MDKVLRYHLMFGVSEDTLKLSLRRSLESGKHLLGSASLLKFDGEIDEGDIGGGTAHGLSTVIRH
jgi:hypothetical protein